ncbi:MAG: hypothetical protein ACYTDY_11335 [Planctomycetota bacterium]|jgi:hypothetical protein
MIRVSIVTALLLALVATAAAAAEPPELVVKKVKIRFRATADPADCVKLKARFKAAQVPAGFDPAVDGVEVTIGPESVTSFPPVEPCGTLAKKGARHIYRERKSDGCGVAQRLVLNLAKGKLALRARGLDLTALENAGREDIEISLRLGETTFLATITFEENGSKWSYKASKWNIRINPPPDGPPDDDPPPDPPEFRILATGAGPYVTTTTETGVARDAVAYQAMWTAHHCVGGTPPAPAVDFDSEIVVLVDLGLGSGNGTAVTIRDFEPVGNGAKVVYAEISPGPGCPIPMLIGSPYVIAAIPRVEGTVTFEAKQEVANCP